MSKLIGLRDISDAARSKPLVSQLRNESVVILMIKNAGDDVRSFKLKAEKVRASSPRLLPTKNIYE